MFCISSEELSYENYHMSGDRHYSVIIGSRPAFFPLIPDQAPSPYWWKGGLCWTVIAV